MKKLLFFMIFISVQMYGQNAKEFLFTPTDEALFLPQKKEDNKEYLNLTFAESVITDLFKDQEIIAYAKAFPKLKSYLNKVYRIVVTENSPLKLEDLLNNRFIEYAELMEEASLASDIIPNDYMLPSDEPNDYLELIRAPMAWSVTKGNPDILVGVADSWFNIVHEELMDKMAAVYLNGRDYENLVEPDKSLYYRHGIEVASLIAGDTNNGLGMASIGYNSKIVGNVGAGAYSVYQLSMMPNIRIINMSFAHGTFSIYEYDLYHELRDDYDIVLVAAAGNGYYGTTSCEGSDGNGYCYPASYEPVISVTGVGSSFERGLENEGKYWKDVAEVTIGDSQSTMTVNDRVNVSAPAYRMFRATNTNGIQGSVDTYTDAGVGTSCAAPLVSGLAALILSVNPELTAIQVKQIIEETTDYIYDIPENQSYLGKLGTGRVNAYRAVMKAHCDLNPSQELDLMIRDSREDYGSEPNTATANGVFWNSVDMWVRNQEDEIEIHENPVYNPNGTSYVYIRIFNKSCQVSSGNEKVKLYWAKASTALVWDSSWNGQNSFSNNAPLGAPIGEITIPSLEPGQDIVLHIPWSVPNPNIYNGINPEPWHFCLLARIDTANDPMTYPEQSFITDNVRKNNNIAWKNMAVINLDPNNINTPIGGVVAVGNPLTVSRAFDLKFNELSKNSRYNLFTEAEVKVDLDHVVFQAWARGGFKGKGIRQTSSNTVIILSQDAVIENLVFEPKELGTVNVKFHFKTKEITENNKYTMNLIQQFHDTKEYLGGEVYEITKQPRQVFFANVGNNLEVDKNETVQLQAMEINEPALYNWYDMDGNLLHEGITFNTSVETNTKYMLEVISLADGFKDDNEVELNLKANSISTIYPNPSSNLINVEYKINHGNSSYISIAGIYGSNTVNNYIIDTNEDAIQIDISQYPSGFYNISLYTDGNLIDSKNLIKE